MAKKTKCPFCGAEIDSGYFFGLIGGTAMCLDLGNDEDLVCCCENCYEQYNAFLRQDRGRLGIKLKNMKRLTNRTEIPDEELAQCLVTYYQGYLEYMEKYVPLFYTNTFVYGVTPGDTEDVSVYYTKEADLDEQEVEFVLDIFEKELGENYLDLWVYKHREPVEDSFPDEPKEEDDELKNIHEIMEIYEMMERVANGEQAINLSPKTVEAKEEVPVEETPDEETSIENLPKAEVKAWAFTSEDFAFLEYSHSGRTLAGSSSSDLFDTYTITVRLNDPAKITYKPAVINGLIHHKLGRQKDRARLCELVDDSVRQLAEELGIKEQPVRLY